MRLKVAIVDYGLGNLFSVESACRMAGMDGLISSDADEVHKADAVILPGVGAFGDAMETLRATGLLDSILCFVRSGKPFFGVCLGMQLMFAESEEFGTQKGLGLIEGKIVRFPARNGQGEVVRIPQIQWNRIWENDPATWQRSPLKHTGNGAYMQFVHSYYAIPAEQENILSFTDYEGVRYASSVIKDNLVGMQFHPEKSGETGVEIYRQWANYITTKSY